jgi:TctA family transporter
MKAFGKLLQLGGLILLPLSMFMEATGGLGRSFGVSDMVIMLVFGFAAFYVGRIVEGYATN